MAKLATTAATAILLASSVIAGCDEEDAGSGDSGSVQETVDPLPRLPRDWEEHVNEDAGFAIGLPPEWSASARGERSELRSPDRLVAISIAADRSEDALGVPLPDLARATLRAGPPGVRKLEAGKPRPFPHRYEAVSLGATAVAGDNPPVRERLHLVVIRRPGLATYTALAAENAETRERPHREEIERALRSLRGRPIGARPRAR